MDGKRSPPRADVNVEEELERFVSQIEENTYAILSIKQKFNLMKGNTTAFETDAHARLNSFESRIDELEQNVSGALAAFHRRLDRIDILAFRPELFHPSTVITIPDEHRATCAFYVSGLACIGTDTSRVLVYNTTTLKLMMEIGPVDGSPVLQIGNVSQTENVVLAVRTGPADLHLLDLQNPSWRRSIQATLHVTWPSNLASPFRLATVEDGKLCFYDAHLSVSHMLDLNPMNMFPAQNRLLVQNEARKLRVFALVDGDVKVSCDFRFEFPVRLAAASSDRFVVAGDALSIAICQYDGQMRFVKVEGPSLFLFAWGQYYFRMGENTLIEARDFAGQREVVRIGNEAWWPHESQTKLATCNMCDSCLITCMDSKCVVWS